jgi:hypothetical protein
MHEHGVHLDISRGAGAGAELLYELRQAQPA